MAYQWINMLITMFVTLFILPQTIDADASVNQQDLHACVKEIGPDLKLDGIDYCLLLDEDKRTALLMWLDEFFDHDHLGVSQQEFACYKELLNDTREIFNIADEMAVLVMIRESDASYLKIFVSLRLLNDSVPKEKTKNLIKNVRESFGFILGCLSKHEYYDDMAKFYYEEYGDMTHIQKFLFHDRTVYMDILKQHFLKGKVPKSIGLYSIMRAQDEFFSGGCRISQIRDVFHESRIPDTKQGRKFAARLAKSEYRALGIVPSEELIDTTVRHFMLNSSTINCFRRLAKLSVAEIWHLNDPENIMKALEKDEVIKIALLSYYHFCVYSDALVELGVYEKAVQQYYDKYQRMYFIRPKYFKNKKVYYELLIKHFSLSTNNLYYIQYLPAEIWLKVGDDFLKSGGRERHLTQYTIIPDTPEGLKFAISLARYELADRDIIFEDLSQYEFIAKEFLLNKYLQFFRRSKKLTNRQLIQLIDYRLNQKEYSHFNKVVCIYAGKDYNGAFNGKQIAYMMDKRVCVLYYQLRSKQALKPLLSNLASSEKGKVIGFMLAGHGYWAGIAFSDDDLTADDGDLLDSMVDDFAACFVPKFQHERFIILDSCATARRPPKRDKQNLAQTIKQLLKSVSNKMKRKTKLYAATRVTTGCILKIRRDVRLVINKKRVDNASLLEKIQSYLPKLHVSHEFNVSFQEFKTGVDCTYYASASVD